MKKDIFAYIFDPDDKERPFGFMIRDREFTNGERWVLASLSEEEARDLYEYLKKHFQ